MRKLRMPLAFGLALALGGTGVAFGGSSSGDGSQASAADVGVMSNHVAVDVQGNTTPRRMQRQRFTNRRLFVQVAHDNSDGSTAVPPGTQSIQIDFGNNIRFRPNRPPKCRANLVGTTTQQVRNRCPARSIIGAGNATVRVPGPANFDDLTTLAIAGPTKNRIRFHAYSPTLGSENAQVIPGAIRRTAPGPAFNWRLNVPNVPEILGGAGANTVFNVAIRRPTGVVQARCRANLMRYRAFWIFRDGPQRFQDGHAHPCQRR